MVKQIVDCTSQFWEFVRLLRSDPRVQDGFIEQVNITEEQQIEYMTKYSHFYRVCLVDGEPAGFVGVLQDDIRVCTHPRYQGMGIGKFMIYACIGTWPTAYAKVKHNNVASNRLFLSCGFKVSKKDNNFTYYTI